MFTTCFLCKSTTYRQNFLWQLGTTVSMEKTCPAHHYHLFDFSISCIHKLLDTVLCEIRIWQDTSKRNSKGSQNDKGNCIPRRIMYCSVPALVFLGVILTCLDVISEKKKKKVLPKLNLEYYLSNICAHISLLILYLLQMYFKVLR